MIKRLTLKDVEQKIAKIVSCDDARVCASGNEAIFTAFLISKLNGRKKILIPDQGGWISYERYPKLLGQEVIKLKTSQGMIETKELESAADKDCALIFPAMAGYFAMQDCSDIVKICNKKNCLSILDATATFPLKEYSDYGADIVLGSFGEWKPLNLGFGGFIAFRSKGIIKEHKDLFSMFKVPEDFIEKLDNGINSSPKKILKLIEEANGVKKDLQKYDIIYPEKIGLNVIVRYADENEKNELIEYCKKNSYEYVECPKNIKVEENAISIELKRQEIYN